MDHDSENIYEVCLHDFKRKNSSSSLKMSHAVPTSFSGGPGGRTTSLVIMCAVFFIISQSSVVAAFLIFPAKITDLEEQIVIIRGLETIITNTFGGTTEGPKEDLYGVTRSGAASLIEALRRMKFAPNCTALGGQGNDSFPHCVENVPDQIDQLQSKIKKLESTIDDVVEAYDRMKFALNCSALDGQGDDSLSNCVENVFDQIDRLDVKNEVLESKTETLESLLDGVVGAYSRMKFALNCSALDGQGDDSLSNCVENVFDQIDRLEVKNGVLESKTETLESLLDGVVGAYNQMKFALNCSALDGQGDDSLSNCVENVFDQIDRLEVKNKGLESKTETLESLLEFNECESSPCLHGGTCIDGVGKFICVCAPGWFGTMCENDVDECEDNPCQKRTVCNNTEGSYTCTCVTGWTGWHCEKDINECEKSPCENGGTCVNTKGSFNCTCALLWTGAHCEEIVRDCGTLKEGGVDTSGMYTIRPTGSSEPFKVYCDMETDGGGWTVFQRRQDGSVDFYKYWADYKSGFGELDAEHWLGNDHLHEITSSGSYKLRVDLRDWSDTSKYAIYNSFTVGPESDKYRLLISGYSGNAGDSMTSSYSNNNQQFSTRDRDNDRWSGTSCANDYPGAWWFNTCGYAYLNGRYVQGGTTSSYGVCWKTFAGTNNCGYSLKFTEMKLRLVS